MPKDLINMPKNNETIDYISAIHSLFGNVKRARGYYLYTEKKERLLDMFLCGGRAILGHKPAGVLTQYKREFEKGITCAFPTKTHTELKTALKALFPQYESYICSTQQEAYHYIESFAKKRHQLFTFPYEVPVYRHGIKKDLGAIFLFFPYPSIATTIILYSNFDDAKVFFPPSAECRAMPCEERAISSFIYALIAEEKRRIEGVRPYSMKGKKALKSFLSTQKELKQMQPMLELFFEIEGRYLYFRQNSTINYKDFFFSALKSGILLSPDVRSPSIFPQIQHYSQLIAFLKKT